MSIQNLKTGIIGGGNMGEAFVGAMIRSNLLAPSMIFMSDICPKRLDLLRQGYHISTMSDNFQLFSTCDVVILCIKPQQVNVVLSEIVRHKNYPVSGRTLLISIAAGVRIGKLESLLYASLNQKERECLPIIRVMPNTPALVLAGISGMTPNSYATVEDLRHARSILEAMGRVIEFREKELDAVTALSGSGPAYIFYLVESMIAGGIHLGLHPDDALNLTVTTLKGAAALLEELNQPPESLRQKVTSPGGTTEAALAIFESHRVKEAIIQAMAAAARRSEELSR